MRVAPYLLYLGARRALRRMLASGYAFDLIDAHYFYPDGVAAVMLGRAFDRPVTITARGSDLNLIPDHALPRRMIRWAAREADGLITVSAALKRRLVDLDVDPARIMVLRNGVDLATFHPIDQDVARARIGLDGRVLAMVGNLVPLKGHDLVIAALPELDGVSLVIAGDGPESTRLKALAAGLGVSDRVRFMGRIAHEALVDVYGAADALVLASSREGWPNVLLEAMACGTPVVATPVGGVGEIVTAPEAGILMTERSASAVADAVRTLFAALPTRAATRAYAMKFEWGETTEGQIALFRRILCRDAPRREDAGNGTLSSDAHLEDEPGNLSMTLPP